jgi:hypothetical protein
MSGRLAKALVEISEMKDGQMQYLIDTINKIGKVKKKWLADDKDIVGKLVTEFDTYLKDAEKANKKKWEKHDQNLRKLDKEEVTRQYIRTEPPQWKAVLNLLVKNTPTSITEAMPEKEMLKLLHTVIPLVGTGVTAKCREIVEYALPMLRTHKSISPVFPLSTFRSWGKRDDVTFEAQNLILAFAKAAQCIHKQRKVLRASDMDELMRIIPKSDDGIASYVALQYDPTKS